MVTLTCQRCEHEWDYTGNQEYYASCPCCRSSVKLYEDSKEDSSKHSGTSDESEASTPTVELASGDMVREVEVTEAVEDLHESVADHGAGQEALRQRVDAIEDDRADRDGQLEEVAIVLKELVEAMGGELEYEALDLDDGPEQETGDVAEVARQIEVGG